MNELYINKDAINRIALEQLELLAERSKHEIDGAALAGITNAMCALIDLILQRYEA